MSKYYVNVTSLGWPREKNFRKQDIQAILGCLRDALSCAVHDRDVLIILGYPKDNHGLLCCTEISSIKIGRTQTSRIMPGKCTFSATFDRSEIEAHKNREKRKVFRRHTSKQELRKKTAFDVDLVNYFVG